MTQHRNLLTHGLGLTFRRFPALCWAFLFNFAFSALTTARIAGVIGHVTDTSLAAQPLHRGFDLATLATLGFKLSEGPGLSPTFTTSIILYLATYFLLVPGTLLCYQTGAPARLATLLQAGLLHFWRFVRITLLSLIVFGLILGPLVALQSSWNTHVDRNTVGRNNFFAELAGILLIALVAAVLRLYLDLVEVYTVQLGLQLRPNGKPDRRVRKTLIPAFRALRHHFARIYTIFLLLLILGLAAVVITARIAMHSLAQPRVWPMFLLAQTGLFLMLLTRFWQRGTETALCLDHPILVDPIVVDQIVVDQIVVDPIVNPTVINHTTVEHTTGEAPTLRRSFVTPGVSLDTSGEREIPPAAPIAPTPVHVYTTDPLPDPEPSVPSLPNPDPGIYRPPTAHADPAIESSDPAAESRTPVPKDDSPL